jgi:hypothetical protein
MAYSHRSMATAYSQHSPMPPIMRVSAITSPTVDLANRGTLARLAPERFGP